MKLDPEIRQGLTSYKKYIEKIENHKNVKEILNIFLDESKSKEQITEAIFHLQKLRDDKCERLAATYLLASCYFYGLGVVKNIKQALELWAFAANQGYSLAQTDLGFCYRKGRGVVKDEKRAAELYMLAAKQGENVAQNNLGFFYDEGIVVSRDEKRAVELYTFSANQGSKIAQYHLGTYYKYRYGIVQDKNRANLLFHASANQGYHQADMEVIHKDPLYLDMAFAQYDALKQKDPVALTTLAFCHQMGLGTSKDIAKAIKLYHQATEKGCYCNFDLYLCYRIQHQESGDTKGICEFYDTIKSSCQSKNLKDTILFAYLHEQGAPGLESQSLLTAYSCYQYLIKKLPIKTQDENVKQEVLRAKKKLESFTLFFTIKTKIQATNLFDPDAGSIIAEYTFDGWVYQH